MDRRNRRLFALAWLFLLHAMADLAIALYRCLEIAPSFTDLLATAVPRAQIGLLVAWLVFGREPLVWRLLGLISSLAWIFTIFSAFHFPGYWKPSIGEAWLISDFAYYFRPTGPGDLLIKAPVIFVLLLVPMLLARLYFCYRKRSLPAKPEEPIAATTHHFFQFRFQDILLWNLTVALVLVAFVSEPHDNWFEVVVERWRIMSIENHPFGRAMQWAAVPSSIAILVALFPTRTRQGFILQAIVIFFVGVVPAMLVDRFCRTNELVSFYAGVWRQFPRETRVVMLASLVAWGSARLVHLYDTAIAPRRVPIQLRPLQPVAMLPMLREEVHETAD